MAPDLPATAPHQLPRQLPKGTVWILLVVFAIYLPSLGNDYAVDAAYLVRPTNADGSPNAVMGQLHGPGFYFTRNFWAANGVYDGLYRPIAVYSFALVNHLVGSAATTHHFFDLLLHLLAVVLVLRLLLDLRVGPPAARWSALLFGVHAIHHEAVVNIVGRCELLSLVGGLGALLLAGRPGLASKVGAGGLLFVAFGSKESSLAWIAFLPCYELARGWRCGPRPWLKTYAAVVLPPLLLWFVLRENALAAMAHVPREIDYLKNPLAHVDTATRILTAVGIWGFGLLKCLVPYPLSHLYGAGVFPLVATPADPGFLAGLAALLGLLGAGLLLARRLPLLFLGVAALLGFGFITSNIPVVAGTNFGERLLYVPSLGLSLLLALVLDRCAHHRRLVLGILALYLVGNAAVVLHRNPTWDSDYALLRRDVQTRPDSANIHDLLAAHLYNAATPDVAQALWHVDRALELYPEYPRALLKRGAFHRQRGELDRAKEFYARCSNSPYILIGERLLVQRDLERLLFPKGVDNASIAELAQTAQREAGISAAWAAYIGRALQTPGNRPAALAQAVATAAQRFPRDPLLALQRGYLAGRDGVQDAAEARAILADLDQGLWRMRPDYTMPYYLPGLVTAARCYAVLDRRTTAGHILDRLLADPVLPAGLRGQLADERRRLLHAGR